MSISTLKHSITIIIAMLFCSSFAHSQQSKNKKPRLVKRVPGWQSSKIRKKGYSYELIVRFGVLKDEDTRNRYRFIATMTPEYDYCEPTKNEIKEKCTYLYSLARVDFPLLNPEGAHLRYIDFPNDDDVRLPRYIKVNFNEIKSTIKSKRISKVDVNEFWYEFINQAFDIKLAQKMHKNHVNSEYLTYYDFPYEERIYKTDEDFFLMQPQLSIRIYKTKILNQTDLGNFDRHILSIQKLNQLSKNYFNHWEKPIYLSHPDSCLFDQSYSKRLYEAIKPYYTPSMAPLVIFKKLYEDKIREYEKTDRLYQKKRYDFSDLAETLRERRELQFEEKQKLFWIYQQFEPWIVNNPEILTWKDIEN